LKIISDRLGFIPGF